MCNNDWKSFMENESLYGAKFLSSHGINDDRHDEDDYSCLKALWASQSMIDKIYSIIDDILRFHKQDKHLRFIFMGDLLFSFTNFEISDPSNLDFTINRHFYISNITLRGKMNLTFGVSEHTYLLMHQKLIAGLRGAKIISRKIRYSKEDAWSSSISMKLSCTEDFPSHTKVIGMSSKPFILINILGTYYSISSFRNMWLSVRAKKEVDLTNPIDLEYLERANKVSLTLSKELYEMSSPFLKNELVRLLESVGCANTEEYYTKLNKAIKDSSRIPKSIPKRISNDGMDMLELKDISITYGKETASLLDIFQKVTSLSRFDLVLWGKIFYLPNFVDFRSRCYYATFLSPTFNKTYRFLYEFGNKKKFTNLVGTYYEKILEYKHLIKKYELCDKNSYILIVLLIEVGKNFVKSLGKHIIKTDEIINMGLDKYFARESIRDTNEMIYLRKIYNLIDNLLKYGSVDENTVIFKDATASGLMNYGLILGYKKDMLKFINLEGDDWCDTYQYLVSKFLKGSIEYNKRKYWKSTIMIIPYNGSWYRCFSNFLKELEKDGIIYQKMEKEKQESLKELHLNFYRSIKNDVKKEFFKKEEGKLLTYNYSTHEVISKKEYKITYKKTRDKYIKYVYQRKHDPKKTKQALESNNIHNLDRKGVNYIGEELEIIAIHDCFGIRLCELHLLMDRLHKYYSLGIKGKKYSLHPVI